jgi:hypothetical protein
MVGERYIARSRYAADDWGGESITRGFGWAIARRGWLVPIPDSANLFEAANERFGAAHSNGLSFVYGDGSVKFKSYNIDQTVYRNLSTRNDGNVINEP